MRPLVPTLKIARLEIPCLFQIIRGFVILLKRRQRSAQAKKRIEILWLSCLGLTKGIGGFLVTSELREQYSKIVVPHRHVRIETNHGSKAVFRLLVSAKFSRREPLEIVESRITRTGRNGIVDNRKSIGRLSRLQKPERLIENRLRVGFLS